MIIERQHLSPSSVRNMCCNFNLYTKGDNEQYEAMLNMVKALTNKSIITAEDLFPIAADILNHSKTDMGVDLEFILYSLGEKIVRLYTVIK